MRHDVSARDRSSSQYFVLQDGWPELLDRCKFRSERVDKIGAHVKPLGLQGMTFAEASGGC